VLVIDFLIPLLPAEEAAPRPLLAAPNRLQIPDSKTLPKERLY